ncbi:MAG: OadG family transporter subunit [Burkholderiales bacterium]
MSDLAWGLSMTVAGMGLVFGLLALLWGLLSLVLRFDRPPAAAAAAPAVEAAPPHPPPAAGIAPELVVAITVATLSHVAALRREAAPLARSYWPGSQLFASRWVAIGRGRQNRSWRRKER